MYIDEENEILFCFVRHTCLSRKEEEKAQGKTKVFHQNRASASWNANRARSMTRENVAREVYIKKTKLYINININNEIIPFGGATKIITDYVDSVVISNKEKDDAAVEQN